MRLAAPASPHAPTSSGRLETRALAHSLDFQSTTPATPQLCRSTSASAPVETSDASSMASAGWLRTTRRITLGATVAVGAYHLHLRAARAALVEEITALKAFAAAADSVVSITSNRRRGSEVLEEATGSGVVWDARGFIVTNYHCVQQAMASTRGDQVTLVRVGDLDETYPVEYVGVDPSHDLAVLRIQAPSETLRPIKIGTSGDLKVGQSVYAIGNPFGLSKTLTAGIVSGLDRGIPTPGGAIATKAIQTDAAVSSGNSGGALLDSSGRLVGISTATFSSNKSMGRGSGVNFAISVDTIREIVPRLIVYGTASGKGVSAREA